MKNGKIESDIGHITNFPCDVLSPSSRTLDSDCALALSPIWVFAHGDLRKILLAGLRILSIGAIFMVFETNRFQSKSASNHCEILCLSSIGSEIFALPIFFIEMSYSLGVVNFVELIWLLRTQTKMIKLNETMWQNISFKFTMVATPNPMRILHFA